MSNKIYRLRKIELLHGGEEIEAPFKVRPMMINAGTKAAINVDMNADFIPLFCVKINLDNSNADVVFNFENVNVVAWLPGDEHPISAEAEHMALIVTQLQGGEMDSLMRLVNVDFKDLEFRAGHYTALSTDNYDLTARYFFSYLEKY